MALLRPVEIAEHASRAGFRGADLQTVVAVGLAESGVGTPLNRKGRSDAHKVTRREDSRGLLQINVKAWPQFAGQDLYDPAIIIQLGAKYVADLSKQFEGDPYRTAAAYNAGPNAVIRAGNRVPPYLETRRYVPRVMGHYQRLKLAQQAPRA